MALVFGTINYPFIPCSHSLSGELSLAITIKVVSMSTSVDTN